MDSKSCYHSSLMIQHSKGQNLSECLASVSQLLYPISPFTDEVSFPGMSIVKNPSLKEIKTCGFNPFSQVLSDSEDSMVTHSSSLLSLKNPWDRVSSAAGVHRVANSRTQLKTTP